MSIGQIIVLTAIAGAFVLFAAVLAWGDYRSRQPARGIGDRDRKDTALAATARASKQAEKSSVAGTAQARWPQPPDDHLQHVA